MLPSIDLEVYSKNTISKAGVDEMNVNSGLFSDSNNEVVEIALREADGVEDVLVGAFKGLVLHLDDSVAIIADVVERGDVGAPVHIAETRDLRAHVLQRIRQHAHLFKLLGIQLDVLEVDVEQLVLELMHGLHIGGALPGVMAGVEVQAEVRAVDDAEQLAENGGRAHQILSAGPLVRAEEHRAVLDRDLHALVLRQLDDGRPDLLEELDVLFHGLVLIPADEGGDHAHAQLAACLDERLQVLDGSFALCKVGIHGVGIVGQGGDMHAFPGHIVHHIFGVLVVFQHALSIDVADTGVAALGLAGGPAGDFEALEAHFRRDVDSLFKRPAIEDGSQ